jgi:hypothetical protein
LLAATTSPMAISLTVRRVQVTSLGTDSERQTPVRRDRRQRCRQAHYQTKLTKAARPHAHDCSDPD